VRFVETLEEDLSRRDFTINAIAYDPLGDAWRDPFDGRRDLGGGTLRAVGKPDERFHEDALRVLRFFRFLATQSMLPDRPTMAAASACARHGGLSSVSPERVHDELYKTMAGANKPSEAFAQMAYAEVLEHILPEALPLIGCTQNRYHAFDVWGHTMRVLDATPRDDVALRFAGLFHDIAKPQTKGVHPTTGEATFYNHEEVGAEVTDGILRRLKFSNEERERIVHHVRWHLIPYEPGWSAAAIRRWVRRIGAGNVRSICELGRADIAGKGVPLDVRSSALDELEERIRTMTINQPIATSTSALAISGKDVMAALSIGPGPRVGEEMRRLLELVTEEPERNTREGLLAALVQNP
jgi:tRNA nucleotidyltransferase (CCA-adding enzyme)